MSRNIYSANAWNAYYDGIKVKKNGSEAYTIGTQFTGNFANPNNLLLTRWTAGGGTPWSAPVNAASVVYSPTSLGLAGKEAWGCRVIKASATDLFISGCTDLEIFCARIDRATFALVTSWGVNGVQSVLSSTPNGCPKHAMPGAFLLFNFYPQASVETVGSLLYLGGTLMNDIAGFPIDYDFVSACYDVNTGALVPPYNVQYSRWLGDENMTAAAGTSTGFYATGTVDPSGFPQMDLVCWDSNRSQRAPYLIRQPTPSRGNDVEAVVTGGNCEIYVGGFGGPGTGATWHYTHTTAPASTVSLPTLWSGGGSGSNPKLYGPLQTPIDEVYDLGLGKGLFAGHVFAVGGVQFSLTTFGQPLQCIAPTGITLFSNNPSPLAPSSDRAVACNYDSGSFGSVYTSGTAFDPTNGSSFLFCPNHWAARSSRYKP